MTLDGQTKLKLVFVISSLRNGGAERVMSNLINELVTRGHELTLITFFDTTDDFYHVDESVQRIIAGHTGVSKNILDAISRNIRSVTSLRWAILTRQPDAVVAFGTETNIKVLISQMLTRSRVVVSERNDPKSSSISGIWRLLRRITYPITDHLVIQTDNLEDWARQHVGSRYSVIPNPITPFEIDPTSQRENIVMAMGRLTHQKGFDLLIPTFAKCVETYPDWQLRIFGEGNDREKLQGIIDNLGMNSHIQLMGRTTTPFAELQKASIFVLSSRWEGQPNVLMEAMAAGCASISFDCQGGPRTVISHGENGMLLPAEDVVKLQEALLELMGDADKRTTLGQHALAIRTQYDIEHVVDQWESICRSIAK